MSRIHKRVADEVFDRLHERIVSGSLAPGDRLDATEVAEDLGVSRTPVREAILRLDAQGLVERVPYKGVVVTGVDQALAEDVTALRIHVETLAARTALPHLTPDALGRMQEIHDRLVAGMSAPDAQNTFRELNREFHLVLYRAAGSTMLLRTIEELADHAERIRLHFDVRQGRAVDDHARILDACRAGDVDAVVAATRDHILGTFLLMRPEDPTVTKGSALEAALAACS